ncbi:MAG: alpha/beta hydrolase [Bacteroidota bacterium]
MIATPAKKWLRRTARFLLGLFLFFNMVMAFNAWKFTHYYDDPELRKPQPKGFFTTIGNIVFGQKTPKRLNDSVPSVPFEKVILKNRDGLKLEAWSMISTKFPVSLHRTPIPFDTTDYSKVFSYHGTVIMFHGQGSCKSAILKEAYEFLELGYCVFMMDFRAHGGSEGEQSTVGIKEAEDVRMAYDYIKDKTKQDPVLYGVSMGAATITKAVATYNLHPSKVILEMPFGSLYSAVKGFTRIKHLPQAFAPFLTFWGGILNGEWAFNHQPTEFAKKITCPVLLQWGANDPRVSKEEEETIFANLGATQKKFVVYENAAHESFCKKEHDKWVGSISSFLAE